MQGLQLIPGYEVQDGSGGVLGPLLMDQTGYCFVIDIKLKEAFPLSNYPESVIIKF